jgi:NAD(P)-dependent dehydrogenase (short-subunit alcohol dehydrogenase family)
LNSREDRIVEIEGKVFIVTGGVSGLGQGTAEMLAREGGRVLMADMQEERGQEVARSVGGAFVKCDVSDETDGASAAQLAGSMGKLVGLVSCAGVAPAERPSGRPGRIRCPAEEPSAAQVRVGQCHGAA